MTPEEYERIKEAEKEHLRALKKLKKAVRDFERSKSIANSVTRMGASSESALETHREIVDKLAMETAQYEARLEVALESAGETAERAARAEELEKMDSELQQERARSLVEDLRSAMLSGADTTEPAESTAKRESADKAGRDEASAIPEDEELPDKTIGRMRRSESDSE